MSRRRRLDWLSVQSPNHHLRHRPAARAPHRRRLRVEPLEDRRLLATFVVDNLNDDVVAMAGDAPGTLRQAIFDANNAPGADTITFAEGLSGTITLTEGELAITDALSITGPGAMQLTLAAFDPTPDEDNGDGSRIFNIDDEQLPHADVSIRGLTLTGADFNAGGGFTPTIGGAILNRERLTVSETIITDNVVFSSGLVAGGAGIYSEGPLIVENSTIYNNRARNDNNALAGGIAVDADFTLLNSTISGNEARAATGASGGAAYGGGVFVGEGTHTIAHSTIADNRTMGMVSQGGGLFVYGMTDITLDHTIVGNNFASMGRDISSTQAVTARFSLIETTAGWTLNDAGGNIFNQVPGLSFDLMNLGGSTPLHVLRADSSAIDAGDPSAVAGSGGVPDFDQRGGPFVRVADGDGNSTAVIDIGAYERQTVVGLSLVVDTVVDEIDDDRGPGDLSLREAIGLTNGSVGAETITFAPELSGQTIVLRHGELAIVDSLTIDADQAGVVTIDARGNDDTTHRNDGDGSRIFVIDDENLGHVLLGTEGGGIGAGGITTPPLEVMLRRLVLTGADSADRGGAIYSEESLHLVEVMIEDNFTLQGGGGIAQSGPDISSLTIERSTISGNVSADGFISGGGGGVGAGFSYEGGGGLYVFGTNTEIINSTISGNRATNGNAEGGGIIAIGAHLTIRHSTISGNTASVSTSRGGNIFFDSFGDGVLTLNHTIVANGISPTGSDIETSDPVMASFSLVENVTGLTLQGTGNVTGLDPNLGPLVENGGPTKTHALLPGSPAIDAGQLTFVPPPDTDQRGGTFVRVFNGDGDAFTIIDIGAYERQTVVGLDLVVDTIVDENDGDYSAGDLSLRDAIGLANGSIGGDTITFAPELVGQTILLNLGELQVVDAAVIDASGLGGTLTVDASGNDPTPNDDPSGNGSRVIHVDDGDAASLLNVELIGLTLTGGDVLDLAGGGAILNSENLTVRQSTITGNAAIGSFFGPPGGPYVTIGGRGGGIHVEPGGALTLVGSTVDSNEAAYGGGLSTFSGQLTITSSTISGNRADKEGGGLWASGSAATIAANHSTIARNGVGEFLVSGLGGGIRAEEMAGVSLNHSIVADNVAQAGPDISSTTAVAFFQSLVENGSGFTPSGGPQLIGVDPLLDPLAHNGGLTRTHALRSGSPAIDAGQLGIPSPPPFDQRGNPFARVVDGNGDTFPRIDLGAYERQTLAGLNLVVDTTSDLVNGNIGPGDLSLREAVLLANGSIGADTITFAPALSGQTTLLVQGEMTILEALTIDATSLAAGVTIDASASDPTPAEHLGDGSRVLLITDQNQSNFIDVELIRLTLTGGDVLGNGGAIESFENLTLTRSTISGNAASDTLGASSSGGVGSGVLVRNGIGGGIAQYRGELTVDSSTISGNAALGDGYGGGIAIRYADLLSLTNSTVSGNSALSDGGGIYLGFVDATELRHTTISENQAAGDGGGVAEAGGGLSLYHTIVANNMATSGADISGGSVPVIYSLVEDPTGFTPTGFPQITGQDPMLGPLANNGGPTQTHALLPGSPAIDAGEFGIPSPPAFDQRGTPFARIVDGNEDTFAVIDMGAYEFDPGGAVLAGDYNQNGIVDAADYTVWQDTFGQTGLAPFSGADGDGDGAVTQADYDVWRSNFGMSSMGSVIAAGELASASTAGVIGDTTLGVEESIATSASTTTDAARDLALAQFKPLSVDKFYRAAPSRARLQGTSAPSDALDPLLLLVDEPSVERSDLHVDDTSIGEEEALPDVAFARWLTATLQTSARDTLGTLEL